MNKQIIFFGVFLSLCPPVMAHSGGDAGYGFVAGLVHPFQGLDHVLFMVAIGLWSSSVRAKKVWLLPLAFLLFMALGALFSYQGIGLVGYEQGIVFSLIVLGGVLLLDSSASIRFMPLLLALFVFYHGYAHGVEIEHEHNPLSYLLGFISSTALLQIIGIALSGLQSVCQPILRKSIGLICLVLGSLSLA